MNVFYRVCVCCVFGCGSFMQTQQTETPHGHTLSQTTPPKSSECILYPTLQRQQQHQQRKVNKNKESQQKLINKANAKNRGILLFVFCFVAVFVFFCFFSRFLSFVFLSVCFLFAFGRKSYGMADSLIQQNRNSHIRCLDFSAGRECGREQERGRYQYSGCC